MQKIRNTTLCVSLYMYNITTVAFLQNTTYLLC